MRSLLLDRMELVCRGCGITEAVYVCADTDRHAQIPRACPHCARQRTVIPASAIAVLDRDRAARAVTA